MFTLLHHDHMRMDRHFVGIVVKRIQVRLTQVYEGTITAGEFDGERTGEELGDLLAGEEGHGVKKVRPLCHDGRLGQWFLSALSS